MYRHVLVALITLTVAVNVQAQNGGQIYLDNVDGLVGGKMEAGGGPVTFHFNYHNLDPVNNVEALTNAFELSTTGGVTWTNGAYGDEFSFGSASSAFDQIWAVNTFSWDGSDADTIGFGGVSMYGSGIPPSYNGPAVYFTVSIDNVFSSGEQFCIDSAFYPPAGHWTWVYGGSVGSLPPDWDGPHCWQIEPNPPAGGRVYLDSADGLVDGNIVIGGGPVTFHFNWENYDSDDQVLGVSTGFELSASGGVTWTNVAYGDEFTWGPAEDNFDFVWTSNSYSWDGFDADTLCFSGLTLFGTGLPPLYNGPAVYFTVDIDDFPFVGEEFCIDSATHLPSYSWMWSWSTGSLPPAWDGPYCFDIVEPGPPGRVYLGSVEGLVDGKIQAGGDPVTFHIRYENYDPINIVTLVRNGFELSATGGVTWSNGAYGDEFSWGPAGDNFDAGWITSPFSWDGAGTDTIGFFGSATSGAGLPPSYDGPAVYMTVDIDDVYSSGEEFCIDSSYFPPSNTWLWAIALDSDLPEWDGPHCWEIAESPNPDDIYWSDEFAPLVAPLNDQVKAMINYGGDLIAGGSFTNAGGDPDADFIACWDGAQWQALGPGLNDSVMSLTVWNGNLIVGGKFTDAGGNADADYIAMWDGSSWTALGTGMNYVVEALTVYGGNLIAGGSFSSAGGATTLGIARWDGATWDSLGAGVNSPVLALTVHNSKLIAAGMFTEAGGSEAIRIASWDGSTWDNLGSGCNNTVFSLCVYDGELIAGGGFSSAGDVPGTERIAAWDGSSWISIGGVHSVVQALVVIDDTLYAGGRFINAGGVPAARIAAYDGSSWSALGSGVNDWTLALASYNGELVAGGPFTTAGGEDAAYIATWDGANWHDFYGGAGLNDQVSCLVGYDNSLIAGGSFEDAGGDPLAYLVADWDGESWSSLGSGIDPGSYLWVSGLTIYDDELVVGGNFWAAGGVSVDNIAVWNGSVWSALGPGLDGTVRCFADYGGELIAGGGFITPVYGLAAWNGSAWHALGSSGVDMGGVGVVALTVWDGKLIAGGEFVTIDGVPAENIAAWDGVAWSPLGTGVNSAVHALTTYSGKLIVGGSFLVAGGEAISGIATWDGSSWSSMGLGMEGSPRTVSDLTVYGSLLIASGSFTTAGTVDASRIAAWDGDGWSALGSGLDAVAYSVGVSPFDGYLYVGGYFSTAGGKPSSHIAKWTKPAGCCAIRGDIDHGGESEPNIVDLVFLVSYMFQGGPEPPCMDEADIDGDGSENPNIADLVHLVAYMFQGGPPPVPCP